MVISSGAINQLTEEELKSLIAYEIGRILNGDNIFKTVFCYSNLITFSLFIVYKLKHSVFSSDKEHNIFTAIFTTLLALIVYGLNTYKFICQKKADENVCKIGYKSELLEYLYNVRNFCDNYEIKVIESRIYKLENA